MVCRTLKGSVFSHEREERRLPRPIGKGSYEWEEKRLPRPRKRQPKAGGKASQCRGNGSERLEEGSANAADMAAKLGRKKIWKKFG